MKKQLLIIDDQASTRKLLGHYLGNFFDVTEMESTNDAIEWLDNGHKPDAIVSDIIMPGKTGVELLAHLQNTCSEMPPVLMLSGVENSSEKMKCFHLGAKDYLVKPFNPEELHVRINNLFHN